MSLEFEAMHSVPTLPNQDPLKVKWLNDAEYRVAFQLTTAERLIILEQLYQIAWWHGAIAERGLANKELADALSIEHKQGHPFHATAKQAG